MTIFGVHITAQIVGNLFGGLSALISLTEFIKKYHQIDSFKIFHHTIEKLKKSPFGKSIPEKDEEFINFIDYGNLLLENFKAQISYRLIIVLSIILSGTLIIPINLGTQLFNTENFNMFDIVIIIIQLGISFIYKTDILFKKSDMKFLRNISMIKNYYYQTYIEYSMVIFNNTLEQSRIMEKLEAAEMREKERVKNEINNWINYMVEMIENK